MAQAPEFGVLLHALRLRAGLTQLDLARTAGMSVRAVRDIEQGRVRRPRAPSVQRLAAALDLGDDDRRALLDSAGTPGATRDRPRTAGPGGELHVEVLGPVTVRRGDQPVDVGSGRLISLLGLLAIEWRRVVAPDEVVDVLWGQSAPATARRQVVRYVRRLCAAAPVVASSSAGFRLALDGTRLDVARFADLTARAEQAERAGRHDLARRLYAGALATWHGPLLANAAPRLRGHPAALALQQSRIAAAIALADLAMARGANEEAVAALRHAAGDEPRHEGLTARLMLALAAGGQQSAALELYHRLRGRLAEELGVEPGRQLQDAYLKILRREVPEAAVTDAMEPAVPAAVRATVPAQLPAAPDPFVGREEQLRRLDELRHGTGAVAVVVGTAGVGKTALALRWAHRVRTGFPDGQLYVNLHGWSRTPPVQPAQALAGFLRALGVPSDEIPTDAAEAAALYRSLLADRRVLVVLDNARDADQARPLLPGSAGGFVVVTSRDRLAGLVAREGARQLRLGVLAPAEAARLLATVLEQRGTVGQPDAVAELAGCCAQLPLALRIAAANLVRQPPGKTVASYVTDLREGNRLGALASDGDELATVRGAFDVSYAALEPAAQRLFRYLGLAPGPDVPVGAAAALADHDPSEAGRLLDRLAAVHLVDEPAPGRFAFHDLLRLYALERTARDDAGPVRSAALRRLHDWYLGGVDAAARVLYPEKARLSQPRGRSGRWLPVLRTDAEALAWLDAERVNLLAAVAHAATGGPGEVAWLLADGLRGYFFLRMNTVDWLAAAEAGRVAAAAAGDPAGAASAHLSLASIHRCTGRYRRAVDEYARAITLARRAGWLDGESTALGNLASTYRQLGELPPAAEHYVQAIELCQRTGWLAGQATAVGNLGAVHLEQGDLRRAARRYREALELTRRIGSHAAEAINLANLGEVHHGLGRLDLARTQLTEALDLHRKLGGPGARAEAMRLLAAVHLDTGGATQARELATGALHLMREVGDRHGEASALNTLGEVYQRGEEWTRAAGCHTRALELARGIESRYPEVVALLGQSATAARLSGAAAGIAPARQALALARAGGFGLLEGQAHLALAALRLAATPAAGAVDEARAALSVLLRTGHRTATAHAHLVLAEALERSGRPTAAAPHRRSASALFASAGVTRTHHAAQVTATRGS